MAGRFDSIAASGVDGQGALRAFRDDGPSAAPLWAIPSACPNHARFSSAPVVSPFDGIAYVGQQDGSVAQINLQNGFNEGSSLVLFDRPVVQPAFDANFTRLMVASSAYPGESGRLARKVTPFPPCGCSN